MCIVNSVGKRAINNRDDVKTIQILLNLNLGSLIPFAPLVPDGAIGLRTINIIEEFQRRVTRAAAPDGKVSPNGPTLEKLRQGMVPGFSPEKLAGIMIHASAATITRYYDVLTTRMAGHGITTPLRMAHFLAQLGHESAEFRFVEEIASGEAYEGRANLGNTEAGDGKRFKGRGLIQITGRANYTAYGKSRGSDYTTDATATLLATDPNLAADASCWFWETKGLNQLADLDIVEAVTYRVNGGYNGLADRRVKLARAKFFLVT